MNQLIAIWAPSIFCAATFAADNTVIGLEFRHAVILVFRGLGRRVTLALLRDDVNENRTATVIPDIPQHRNKVIEIMTVYRANVVEA